MDPARSGEPSGTPDRSGRHRTAYARRVLTGREDEGVRAGHLYEGGVG
ncbi:hypothetical protein [Streptomyces sp. NPDC002685]